MKYKIINKSKAEDLRNLAVCLTSEIVERTGIKHFDADVPLAVSLRNWGQTRIKTNHRVLAQL